MPIADLYDYDPDALPADLDEELYHQLQTVDGVTPRKAALLADTYENATTISWATRHDRQYIREQAQLDPGFLREGLRDAGLYRYHRQHKGKLAAGIPDRCDEYVDRIFPIQSELDDYDADGWVRDG